jgi:hypothetical protein
MKLHVSDVLARAAQRGYTPDEIRPCLVKDLGNGWYEVDTESASYPKHKREGHVTPPGLGDIVSGWLSAFGITKDRVSRVMGGPCGCEERQAALNIAGAAWLGLPPGSTAPPLTGVDAPPQP